MITLCHVWIINFLSCICPRLHRYQPKKSGLDEKWPIKGCQCYVSKLTTLYCYSFKHTGKVSVSSQRRREKVKEMHFRKKLFYKIQTNVTLNFQCNAWNFATISKLVSESIIGLKNIFKITLIRSTTIVSLQIPRNLFKRSH